LSENLKRRDHFGYLSADTSIILKRHLKGIQYEGVDWIQMALADVNTVMNLTGTLKARNFLTSWATISFSIRILLHGAWKTKRWRFRIQYQIYQIYCFCVSSFPCYYFFRYFLYLYFFVSPFFHSFSNLPLFQNIVHYLNWNDYYNLLPHVDLVCSGSESVKVVTFF